MNENTSVANFFIRFDIFLFHFLLFFLYFCLLSYFEIIKCIVNTLITTSAEIPLKKQNLKSLFWGFFLSLGTQTGIAAWIRHWSLLSLISVDFT